MSLFYTGKGDKGKSDLGKPLGKARGIKKVSKRRPEVVALYNLDELNSLLGLVKHQKLPKDFVLMLEQTQENLFIVQAGVGYLLSLGDHRKVGHSVRPQSKNQPPSFSGKKVIETEKLIDGFEKEVNPARGFVVPGVDEASAWLHFARAVSRRTEISLIPLREKLPQEIVSYMNRLSSLLYAMARTAVVRAGLKEKNPKYK